VHRRFIASSKYVMPLGPALSAYIAISARKASTSAPSWDTRPDRSTLAKQMRLDDPARPARLEALCAVEPLLLGSRRDHHELVAAQPHNVSLAGAAGEAVD
jgi:hypothetical protein